jgi:hypothetical protein
MKAEGDATTASEEVKNARTSATLQPIQLAMYHSFHRIHLA